MVVCRWVGAVAFDAAFIPRQTLSSPRAKNAALKQGMNNHTTRGLGSDPKLRVISNTSQHITLGLA